MPASPAFRLLAAGWGAVAAPVGVWTILTTLDAPLARSWPALILLASGLVVTEAAPVRISDRGRNTAVTFSGGYAIALVLLGPMWIALLAQLAAAAYDEVRLRNPWSSVFNVALFTLLLSATSGAFRLVSRSPVLGSMPFTGRELAGLAAAGVAYAAVNHLAVTLFKLVRIGGGLRSAFTGNGQTAILTYAMDLALAPLAIAASAASAAIVPMVALPTLIMFRSTRVAAEKEQEALHDVLTGLPNRALLRIRYDAAATDVHAGTAALAVLLVDLDHFKQVNDTYGHHIGDELLREVSRRLLALARTGDTVCRLGGDEFAILARLDPAHAREEAEGIAGRYVHALREPLELDDLHLDIQGSVGLAVAPEQGEDIETLMTRADVALYRAKEQRGGWAAYDGTEEAQSEQRLTMTSQLRTGLSAGEVELRFLPRREGESITVATALPYWRHPQLDLLRPEQFLPLIGDKGVIRSLISATEELAVAQARRWIRDGSPVRIALRPPPGHVLDVDRVTRLENLLQRHHVPAAMLTVQLDEPEVVTDLTSAAEILPRLAALGLRVEVTGYGSGIASVELMHRLGVTDLHLAGDFAAGVARSEPERVIVASTLGLAARLGIRTWTAGVDQSGTRAALEDLGCLVAESPSVPLTAAELSEEPRRPAVSPAGAPD